jgi:oxygen-dependent protoporphyrinogen oxidase
VIVGGGITGLATAYYLRRALPERAPVEVVVLESDTRPGGKLRTLHHAGFTVETGPDSFLTGKPGALALCHDLGLDDDLIAQRQPRGAYVLRSQRLIPIPPGMRLIHPTSRWQMLRSPLLSPAGRLRALAYPFARRRRETGDESIGEYVKRRYGAEMLRVLGEPLLAGIHLADPWKLSLEATFPALHAASGRRGSTGQGPPTAVPKQLLGSPFASLAGGMEQLSAALIAELGPAVSTDTTVHELIPSEGGYRLSLQGNPNLSGHYELPADAVVVTTPAAAAARLLRGVNPTLARLLESARATSSAIVTLGFRDAAQALPPGSGFLVPSGENSRLLACTWSSNKFAARAPKGGILVRGFVGGWRDAKALEMDDGELVELVRRELAALLGGVFAGKEPPTIGHVARWPEGTPLYQVGHRQWLEKLATAGKTTPGLWLAGAPYDGVGIPDCIRQARDAAGEIAHYLG